MIRQLAIAALIGVASLAGCGKDSSPSSDMGSTADMIGSDADMAVTDATVTADVADMAGADTTPTDTLCNACTNADECGGPDDLCLTIVQGESFCSRACDDATPCPTDYFCAVVDADTGSSQCVPDNFTCIDRCSSVTCTGNDICDPFTGECRRPLRLCETGCSIDALCGDGPEDICLNVTNTPDQERSCFTGCDPQAEMAECPADYFCAPLDPDNAPERGVCYPFAGTCVDRCATVDCPVGENCNPVTGECSAAQYGPCEQGCTNSTQCGGQDDLCLDLGIGDGAHCWQECSATECASGYDCRALLGTTIRVCIPLGNDCSACYDNDCFPDGVCDPVADTCEPLPQACVTDGDCAAGELCDPTSSSCVVIDRSCSGSTWAVDCDNAVTKCTSQRAGVDGTCAQLCSTSADCQTGTCVSTNLGSLCLAEDLGGASTCGTIGASGAPVGAACGPSGCFGGANICIEGGNIDGFCSRPCVNDSGCAAGEVCRGAAGIAGTYCLPANCLCAGGTGLPAASEQALDSALTQLGLSQCGITYEASRYAGLPGFTGLPGESSTVARRVAYPLASTGLVAADTQALDGAANLADAIARSAALGGITLVPQVRTFTYPGAQGPLAQAIGELITASGGSPDLTALDASVAGVPAAVQAAAAPVVSAVAIEVSARRALLTSTWGASGAAQAVFDGAPWVLLPADATQAAAALDPSVPADATRLDEATSFANQLVGGADFVGQLPDALAALGALGTQTFPAVSIPTPAGRVVVAGSGADVHDIAAHGTEIAVLIDLGGDDTYRVPAGANASLANGVSVLLDLGGSDTYTYDVVADPNDGVLLPSDVAGRIAATLPLNQANGPVSASETARQGAGRLGIGILVDVGAGVDTYASLRMSQGAAVFGLGVLWDDGQATFTAEALAQGAALGGVAMLWAGGSSANDYRIWHAGQGFGSLGGTGIAFDRAGGDHWLAEPGISGTVLYLSTADRGVSNRNLAQGAAFGELGGFAGGIGVLRDAMGSDTYDAGTYAQGYAVGTAFAAIADGAGDDVYNGRGLVQGVGESRGGGAFRDAAGDDLYNQTTAKRLVGQGSGQTLGWGTFVDLGGVDQIAYLPSGGGVGIDGGFGLALSSGGADAHQVSSDASWGFAQINATANAPGFGETTIGIFVDTGANTDTYMRPTLTGVMNNGVWSPGANPPIYALGMDN